MEPLKYLFNENVVTAIAESAEKYDKDFKKQEFIDSVLDSEWEIRELKDRINFIAFCLGDYLTKDFKQASSTIEKMSEELPSGFEQMPLPTFIELFGLDHFDVSLKTLEKITKGSTGEFAIRPFLKLDAANTLKVMKKWAVHKNEHVRRLSSEGCRPRLPWGGNFQAAIKNPSPVLEILETLKNDDSLYVRKSVANNLNDISKDNPELLLQTGKRWVNENHKHAKWIVKKGLRGLLKDANPSALQLFGYGNPDSILFNNLTIKNKVIKIGDRLDFSFDVINSNVKKQKLRIEYLIEYQKKRGSSKKVFQLSEMELDTKTERKFEKYQSFADMTTRKHVAGNHELFIRVNGELKGSRKFELLND